MSDWQYVRRRPGLSWHIVRTHTRAFQGWIALCGRRIVMDDNAALGELPGNEKTCERCAVIAVKQADPGQGEDDGSTHDELVP